jgi:MFS transporter, DHA1 family, multidrug resistance protein
VTSPSPHGSSPAPAPGVTVRHRTRTLVALATLTTFGPMSMDLYLPGFPSMAADFGTDTGSIQLTMSTCFLGLGIGQVIWGPLSDRYGRRRPMAIGVSVFIVASLLIAVAPTFGALVALRFVQALGGAAGVVIARAVVRDLYSGRELARAMSAIITVFAIAPVVAPIIGSGILAVATWQWMFVFLAAFGCVALALALWLPETLPRARRTQHGIGGAMRGYRDIAASREFRYAAIIATLGSTALYAYISSSPVVIIDFYGVGEAAYALIFGGLALGVSLGAQVNMRLLRRFRVVLLLRSAATVQLVASAAVLVVAVLHGPLVVLLVPLAVALMTVAGVNSNGISMSMDPFPRAAASAAALVGMMQMLMGTLTSAALSAMSLPAPVEMGLVMTGAGLVSVTMIAIGLVRAPRRVRPEPAA